MGGVGFEAQFAVGLLKYLGFLVAITMYQAGIALMAQRRGDRSYETSQRATLSPLPHIDILGTIILPLITILAHSPVVFGWPKVHRVDTRYFLNPRRDINLVYIAGVGINFLIAVICIVALRLLGGSFTVLQPTVDFSDLNILIRSMLGVIGLTNITIGALFLLPVPGSTGWMLLINNVSFQRAQEIQQKALYFIIGFFLLVMIGALNFYFEFFLKLFMLAANISLGF